MAALPEVAGWWNLLWKQDSRQESDRIENHSHPDLFLSASTSSHSPTIQSSALKSNLPRFQNDCSRKPRPQAGGKLQISLCCNPATRSERESELWPPARFDDVLRVKYAGTMAFLSTTTGFGVSFNWAVASNVVGPALGQEIRVKTFECSRCSRTFTA
ncbi:hypothetical protein B0H19DRAFT_1233390 [Mycena capillaripes]|nr:hypothetical protein B0H19DRAFT_1233390 [Mycena capillaripes]